MKPLVAIFAHPDDETFGPAGKIILEAKRRDVYIICVTDGSQGINSTNSKKPLSEIRKHELRMSAKNMGVKKVIFFNYRDGSLNNLLYHEIAGKITKELQKIRPDTLLTYEPHGVSGHLDHIAVSFITTFVFYKLDFTKKLYYHCRLERKNEDRSDYFVYFPKGYERSEIDLIVNTSKVWNKKVESMKMHKSQKHDAERILKDMEKRPKEEYFLVREK